MTLEDSGGRGSRTYVRRRGRMTRGQQRAMQELAPRFCLDPATPVTAEAFQRPAGAPPARLGLEIGFGMGQGLIDWALERPDWNLLGVEVYQPGIGSALLGIERERLDHVRLLEAPAERVLEDLMPAGVLDEVRIFFPDPWPKKRHHKRRLLQPAFAALLGSRLAPGGLLWVATDWEPYADWMVAVLDAEPTLGRESEPRISPPGGPDAAAGASSAGTRRTQTRFEARGRRLGHRVWDLRYVRKR